MEMRFLWMCVWFVSALAVNAEPKKGAPPRAILVKEKEEAAVLAPRVMGKVVGDVSFQGVGFDSRSHRLVVVDQVGGPGSEFADSEGAALAKKGLAAVNAGFFTPEGAPLGLVGSSGKFTGAWNGGSSLGGGVWFESPAGRMGISRREKLGRKAAGTMAELIQAGPMLVENGRSIGGLERTKTSARSVILWDGGTRWWIGCSSPCSLAELTELLVKASPTGWPVRQGLNLDGGRSADLWVSGAAAGGPVRQRSMMNRAVRNFVVLVKR